MTQHPAPWWYRLLAFLWPARCREIPEANNPTWPDGSPRIVLRQFAIIKNRRELQVYALARIEEAGVSLNYEAMNSRDVTWSSVVFWRLAFWRAVLWVASFANLYLQQFACSEDPRFMHSHQYQRTLAVGLWGRYTERRIAGRTRSRRAPYLYTMDDGHVHHVQEPGPGHTSLFLGLFRAVDGSQGDKHYYATPAGDVSHLLEEAAARIEEATNGAIEEGLFDEGDAEGDRYAIRRMKKAAYYPQTYRKIWSEHIREFVARI